MEVDLNETTQQMVLFYHTDKLNILELANSETNPPENNQYNDTTLPVNTQPSLSHSPPGDTSFASVELSPCQRVEAGDAALQAQE